MNLNLVNDVEFYDRYPMMQPYVGKSFGQAGKPSLLLIGESHYLPECSKQHLSVQSWYQGNSDTLTEFERGWISVTQIIEDSRIKGFTNKAHSIWKNSFHVINEFGPRYPDFRCVADDIAFYNFFLRPAREGQSLQPMEVDIELANKAFLAISFVLKPTGIVFLSINAYRHYRESDSIIVKPVVTPHPSCRWWNRAAKKYGNKNGKAILGDFVSAIWKA